MCSLGGLSGCGNRVSECQNEGVLHSPAPISIPLRVCKLIADSAAARRKMKQAGSAYEPTCYGAWDDNSAAESVMTHRLSLQCLELCTALCTVCA